MKRSVLFSVLGLLVLAVAAEAATPLARGPYSGAPTADSIVISWMVVPSLPSKLDVSPVAPSARYTPDGRSIAVGSPTEGKHGQVDVLVDGLEPATTYIYRVTVQSGSEITTSPVGRFETAPASGQPVTFAVLSDTQWQWGGANRLAVVANAIAFDSARSGGFDFILHAGDIVETPNAYYWEPWFNSFEPMLLAAPFIPVLGNHEKNSVSYYNAFSHPAGAGQNDERWWTLRWGDVVVVGLDTSVNRADRIMDQQAYARAELAGNERWKFVIFHHPVYSSDGYHGSGYGYETIYHPIFVESGVDIVFNGHAHNYERIEKDGIVYLVLGGGGAVPRDLASTRVDGSVVAIENHSFYARVSVTPCDVAVDVVSVAEATETTFMPTPGELLDSFTLRAPEMAGTDSSASPGAAREIVLSTAEATELPAADESVLAASPVVSETPVEEEIVEPVMSEGPTLLGLSVATLAALLSLAAAIVWVVLRVGH